MAGCTFFGHRECPDWVEEKVKAICRTLIEHYGINRFYVGNQGAFDRKVRRVLKEISCDYPHIRCEVVLAYRPAGQAGGADEEWTDTFLPSGIENIPARAAIAWRNEWMIKQADYVVVYVARSIGGAYRYAQLAKKKGKTVINIAEGGDLLL